MEQCFETSAYKIQTPGNYPEEGIQHSGHSESSKSRMIGSYLKLRFVKSPNLSIFVESDAVK